MPDRWVVFGCGRTMARIVEKEEYLYVKLLFWRRETRRKVDKTTIVNFVSTKRGKWNHEKWKMETHFRFLRPNESRFEE